MSSAELDHPSSEAYPEKAYQQGGAITAQERRRAALAEIDEAHFSWFHVKACLVAGEYGRGRQWQQWQLQNGGRQLQSVV